METHSLATWAGLVRFAMLKYWLLIECMTKIDIDYQRAQFEQILVRNFPLFNSTDDIVNNLSFENFIVENELYLGLFMFVKMFKII